MHIEINNVSSYIEFFGYVYDYYPGSGMAPEAGARRCHVCNVPVDKEYASKVNNARAASDALHNPHLLGGPAPKEVTKDPLKGRWSKK